MNNELFPIVCLKKTGNEWSLTDLVGPEVMFQRLGEFLAVMTEQDGFYFSKVENDDETPKIYLVEMEPKDGEATKNNEEDMGEGRVTVSQVKNIG
jgi:hypothetical protein